MLASSQCRFAHSLLAQVLNLKWELFARNRFLAMELWSPPIFSFPFGSTRCFKLIILLMFSKTIRSRLSSKATVRVCMHIKFLWGVCWWVWVCRYTLILAIFEAAFVFLDRTNCRLIGLRLFVGILASATLMMHLHLLFGQVSCVSTLQRVQVHAAPAEAE